MVELRIQVKGPLTPESEEKILIVKLFLLAFILTSFGQNICFTLLNLSFLSLTSEQRVLVRIFNQPVQWSLQLILFTGIVTIFYKQGRKKTMVPPKTTFSTLLNTHHDLETDYDEERTMTKPYEKTSSSKLYDTTINNDESIKLSESIKVSWSHELYDETRFL